MNNRFDTCLNKILYTESTILEEIDTTTIPRNSLDPAVFQYPDQANWPIMQPMVATQILGTLEGIERLVPIRDFYITGDCLEYGWRERSPIDVKVFIDPENMDDITTENIYNYVAKHTGKLALGTTHPIFYYIIQKLDNDPADEKVVYDIANERWLKEPRKKLNESIIDYAHKSLDPKIWDIAADPPVLKSEVKDEVLQHLKDYFGNDFNKYANEVHITGSIGTQQWKSDTDIDVHIVPKDVEKNISEYEPKQSKIKHDFDDKGITIAGHPYEVYLQLDPGQEMRGDASYDVLNDKWIKLPFSLSDDFDPEVEFAYLKKDLSKIFKTMDSALGELRRDLVDYDIIDDYVKHLEPEEKSFLKGKLDGKLKEIENDIDKLVKHKTKYHQARKSSYGPEDAEEIWKQALKSKSWAPGNVMWKMLDRYKYVTLILALQKVMREDEDQKFDHTDIKDIKKVFNFKEHRSLNEGSRRHRNSKRKASGGAPTRAFSPRSIEDIATAKGKNRWKDPLAKHSMVAARGAIRKSLSQVADRDRVDRFSRELPFAERILDIAKAAQAGSWKLTERQVLEVAEKYGVKVPTMKDRIKKLGKTGIVLFRRSPSKILLIKTASTVRSASKPGKKRISSLKKAFKMPSFKQNFRK